MNKISYCGFDCERCSAYIATKNKDIKLKKETAELWSRLNNVVIEPYMIDCEGCKENGIKSMYCKYLCEIKECLTNKDIECCEKCNEYNHCHKVKVLNKNFSISK